MDNDILDKLDESQLDELLGKTKIDDNTKEKSEESKEVKDENSKKVKPPKCVEKLQPKDEKEKEDKGPSIAQRLNKRVNKKINDIKNERKEITKDDMYSNGIVRELPCGVSYVENDYDLLTNDDGILELMASFVSALLISPIRLFTEVSRKIILLGKDELDKTINTSIAISVLYTVYTAIEMMVRDKQYKIYDYLIPLISVGVLILIKLMIKSSNNEIFKYKLYFDKNIIRDEEDKQKPKKNKINREETLKEIKKVKNPSKIDTENIITFEEYEETDESKIIADFLNNEVKNSIQLFEKDNFEEDICVGLEESMSMSELLDYDLND